MSLLQGGEGCSSITGAWETGSEGEDTCIEGEGKGLAEFGFRLVGIKAPLPIKIRHLEGVVGRIRR